jgi:hypothetical protein
MNYSVYNWILVVTSICNYKMLDILDKCHQTINYKAKPSMGGTTMNIMP